jgi:hypothetical protein
MTAPRGIQGSRWKLLQALAWVMTRDEDLSVLAGMDVIEGNSLTPTWLNVAAAQAGTKLGVSEAWRRLADEIVCNHVAADGRPDRVDGQLTDRVPLRIEARDLMLDGERHEHWRHCFLTGTSPGQRSWFDVELSKQHILNRFPPVGIVRSMGGAPEKYEWGTIKQHALSVVNQHGLPGRGNKALPTVSELVEQLLQFCTDKFDEEPSYERMRTNVRGWLKELRSTG